MGTGQHFFQEFRRISLKNSVGTSSRADAGTRVCSMIRKSERSIANFVSPSTSDQTRGQAELGAFGQQLAVNLRPPDHERLGPLPAISIASSGLPARSTPSGRPVRVAGDDDRPATRQRTADRIVGSTSHDQRCRPSSTLEATQIAAQPPRHVAIAADHPAGRHRDDGGQSRDDSHARLRASSACRSRSCPVCRIHTATGALIVGWGS